MITFKSYQETAVRTLSSQAKYMTKEERLILALGLAGEVGETIDYLKKIEGHGHVLDQGTLLYEVGDVLWYLAGLCSAYGLSLEDAAEQNIIKLRRRYPDGFSRDASRNREVLDA